MGVVSVSPAQEISPATKTYMPVVNQTIILSKVNDPIARPPSTIATMSSKDPSKTSKDKDKSKVHKLSLKGSAKLVAEFVRCLPPPAASRKLPRS